VRVCACVHVAQASRSHASMPVPVRVRACGCAFACALPRWRPCHSLCLLTSLHTQVARPRSLTDCARSVTTPSELGPRPLRWDSGGLDLPTIEDWGRGPGEQPTGWWLVRRSRTGLPSTCLTLPHTQQQQALHPSSVCEGEPGHSVTPSPHWAAAPLGNPRVVL